ncbi:crustacean hyperglycemic hormone [Penaeus vannamei]|uniref:crustacean hyperglycemic hormone n=1 Tax=Penaeus vannamei TaxID=6689 RepID=UPI00387F9153
MIALRLMAVTLLAALAASTTWARSFNKRANFDPSCTGVYDRELLGRLSRLCDDCDNVYREPTVATGCRSSCFYNPVFVQCLKYLIPADLHEEYQGHVQTVGK